MQPATTITTAMTSTLMTTAMTRSTIATTTARVFGKDVLVLSTFNGEKNPKIISFDGELELD